MFGKARKRRQREKEPVPRDGMRDGMRESPRLASARLRRLVGVESIVAGRLLPGRVERRMLVVPVTVTSLLYGAVEPEG